MHAPATAGRGSRRLSCLLFDCFTGSFPDVYASPYGVPRSPDAKQDSDYPYIPENIQELGHNIHGSENTQEPYYHVLEEPTSDNERPLQNDGSISSEQPVYNLKRKLATEEVPNAPANHGTEPVYDVLEDPSIDDAEVPGHFGATSSERANLQHNGGTFSRCGP